PGWKVQGTHGEHTPSTVHALDRTGPTGHTSAGLTVLPVRTAVRAELLDRETVGRVPTVLARDVVPSPARLAVQGDLRPHVGGSHVGVPFSLETMALVRRDNTTRFPQARLVIDVSERPRR